MVERPDGELISWNCKAVRGGADVIHIEPGEEIVSRVHLNLRGPSKVEATFANSKSVKTRAEGMQWIGPGGVPELFSSTA